MRVAAVYDIHGNLPALEAVLKDVRRTGVDRIVVGGDVVPGPLVTETFACLRGLDIPCDYLMGNGEVAVLNVLAGGDPGPLPGEALDAVRWSAQQFRPELEQFVAAWPKTLTLEIPDVGPVLFCHGTPRHENECFTRVTSEDKLRPIFDGLGAAVVVCGHTHMQFDRFVGPTRVVNAGSVGMPFGRTGADWLLVGPSVELRHTAFNLGAAVGRMLGSGYPLAQQFVSKSMLHPPSEEAMIAMFSRAELQYGEPV